MSQFERYIGVDYSGAETAESSLKGLRIYAAKKDQEPYEVLPQVHPSRGHRNIGLGEGLVNGSRPASAGATTLVGIDHGFSFPCEYSKRTTFCGTGPAFSMTSSDIGRRQREYLRRFRARWARAKRCVAMRKGNVATDQQRGAVEQIGIPFRCAGLGRKVDSQRDSLASFHSVPHCGASSLLALRRLADSGGEVGHRRGLPSPVEQVVQS